MKIPSLFFFFLIYTCCPGQSSNGFLFGKVTLKNDRSYTGVLRWENRAGAWDDLFEAYKDEPQIQEQIDIQGYEQSEDNAGGVFDLSFMNLWENTESRSRFAFRCQFGHIDKITGIRDKKSATVLLKNGAEIKLRRRGDDIGRDIILYHSSLGKLEFNWIDIKEIDFFQAPGNVGQELNQKIFGQVTSVDGPLKGFIVWDFDEEAFGRDIIDGVYQKVDYEIEFRNIRAISPEREGAILTLKDGSEIFLKSSSDVNEDNDGIFIKTQNSVLVNLNWKNLIRIDFTRPKFQIKKYHEYQSPRLLQGKLETKDGKSIKGTIVYDLDETWDIEMLEGESKGNKYFIPFHQIKKITPQNYNYSLVELTDGTNLMLGDEGDVSFKNHGILVWITDSKTVYTPWKEIKSVTFTSK